MNKIELLEEISRQGIPKNVYSFSSLTNDSYCIERSGKDWIVYFADKGTKVNEAVFATECDAYKDLLKRLMPYARM